VTAPVIAPGRPRRGGGPLRRDGDRRAAHLRPGGLDRARAGPAGYPRGELAPIGSPVLLVHGRDDRVVPWRDSSAQLVDLLPDSRLHVLSGCGHWTMIEKTAEFLAVVQPFLSG
jgi:pimeloyl-ACP methyl ester carboxylesterase